MSNTPTIRILGEYTAKQIAAGEVIERPSCVVRELIDNSIDAGSHNIEVQLKNGGLDSICVSDDGRGMSAEDLALCCYSHATSKIQSAEDLLALSSMGFRGEALASISAISKTIITSFDSLSKRAHEITVEGDKSSEVHEAVHNKGTRICIQQLFGAIPVRKKFLASISAERMRVKNIMVEKAAAFPNIAFTLKEGVKTIVRIPREDAFTRAVRVSNQEDSRMFVWYEDAQEGHAPFAKEEPHTSHGAPRMQAALGLTEIATRTRKHIHLYVNQRPVRSFQLAQAVEYAYKDIIHTGAFPQAVVFLSIAPSEVDVNVHPSKQEVRIKPMAQVRSLIIRSVASALESQARALPQYKVVSNDAPASTKIQDIFKGEEKPALHFAKTAHTSLPKKHSASAHRHIAPRSFSTTRNSAHAVNAASISALSERAAPYKTEAPVREEDAFFIGCAFASYAVFEVKTELLFLDFHATHERQLFDALLEKPQPQPLVVPVPLVLDMAEETRTLAQEAYKHIGIVIEEQKKDEEPHYALSQVPQALYTRATSIAELIDSTDYAAEGVNLELFARKACKGAVKAGDHIDAQNAYALLSYAQKLERPRCPHGRPLWASIAKSALDSMVGRTA